MTGGGARWGWRPERPGKKMAPAEKPGGWGLWLDPGDGSTQISNNFEKNSWWVVTENRTESQMLV